MRVLIVVAEFGDNSVHPCGKDMYALSQKLLQTEDILCTVFTPTDNRGDSLAKLSVARLRNIGAYRQDLIERFSSSQNWLQKFILRIYLHFLNSYIDKGKIKTSKIIKRDLGKLLKKQECKFDLLISVSYPFYIQELAGRLKKKLKIKKWVPYILDPYVDNKDCTLKHRKRRNKQERKIFEQCTKIFTVEEVVSKAHYSPIGRFQEKIQYIPTHLMSDNTRYHVANESGLVHFVYTGLFYLDIRNPEKLLQYFTQLPSNYILHLYCKGCEDVIEKYKTVLGERLQVNDYILDIEEYNKMIGRADFLIDVGNTVSNQVPSKILTYCSFGKPILHFKNCADEVIGEKFSKYSLLSIVDYSEDVDGVTNKIVDFVAQNKGKTIPYSDIKENFFDCTVEFVADKVEQILRE